ncbi:LAO/AO transport system kinase [Haloferula luteola]|uniref:LAO/AO transport system kinase n=1 Tax=Haloferula luteola TaxID=595692 RepID=A0A840V3B5_9BACT|nr:LAO/AO transport system kinase [Haloferula luteola]
MNSESKRPEWAPEDDHHGVFASEVRPGVRGGTAVTGAARRRRPPLSAAEAVEGVRAGNRTLLARAITLIESRAAAHRKVAAEILRDCLPWTGNSIRIGITGVPGAGKSTFIERFGLDLCEAGHRVAVLAVDPTSAVSGGSVLGDKTRMEDLSRHPGAFIRPSPAGGTLGGVAARTRETLLLCEAAGYDVILVETVGVGQSEVAVRTMVDFFLLLQIAGAGDELQGIKKGVIEMADAILVNKADGENQIRAEIARGEYARVLHYLSPFTPGWVPQALACSALDGTGVAAVWELIGNFREVLKEKEMWESRRREQNVQWFHSLLKDAVLAQFYESAVAEELPRLETAVAGGRVSVTEAVQSLVDPGATRNREESGYGGLP